MSKIRRFAWLAARLGANIPRDYRKSLGGTGRPLRIESLEDRRLLSITVNTLVDENDGVGVGGISLRDAIAAAASGETIDFAPALTSSGPATISLTRGQLVIARDLTINGPGAALLTVDASGNDSTPNVNEGNGSRVFHIDDGANSLKNVVVNGLRLTGGDASGPGGAIFARENLTMSGCVVTGNATYSNTQLGGGGIYSSANTPSANSLTLLDCAITNNAAVRDEGGGIRKQRGALVMEGCTVSGNTAAVVGGGLSAADGSVNLQIRSSTFNSNVATGFYGGGMFVYSGVLSLTDSTLSGNSATYGAGLYFSTTSQGTVVSSTINNNTASVDGGGVYVDSSQLTIVSSTLSSNTARGFGGGAAMPGGTLTLRHSTVTANRADFDNTGGEQGGGLAAGAGVALTLDHTIVAGNLRGASTRSDATGPIAARFSLIGDNTGATITDNGGNLIGSGAFPVSPMLGSLANNGGPTRTHSLLPGSPAIDAGDPAAMAGTGSVPSSDQRGVPFVRNYDGGGDASARIDIGAYEVQAPGIAADFDGDQDVDGADFLTWQRGLGLSGAVATKNSGNADGDDDVDGVDLAAWRAAFGAAEQLIAVAAASERLPNSLELEDLTLEESGGRIRASLSADTVDAAMAAEHFLAASAPRRHGRLRLLRSK